MVIFLAHTLNHKGDTSTSVIDGFQEPAAAKEESAPAKTSQPAAAVTPAKTEAAAPAASVPVVPAPASLPVTETK